MCDLNCRRLDYNRPAVIPLIPLNPTSQVHFGTSLYPLSDTTLQSHGQSMVTIEVGRVVNQGKTLPSYVWLKCIGKISGEVDHTRFVGRCIGRNIVQCGIKHDDFGTCFFSNCTHPLGIDPNFPVVLYNFSFDNDSGTNRWNFTGVIPSDFDDIGCVFNL